MTAAEYAVAPGLLRAPAGSACAVAGPATQIECKVSNRKPVIPQPSQSECEPLRGISWSMPSSAAFAMSSAPYAGASAACERADSAVLGRAAVAAAVGLGRAAPPSCWMLPSTGATCWAASGDTRNGRPPSGGTPLAAPLAAAAAWLLCRLAGAASASAAAGAPAASLAAVASASLPAPAPFAVCDMALAMACSGPSALSLFRVTPFGPICAQGNCQRAVATHAGALAACRPQQLSAGQRLPHREDAGRQAAVHKGDCAVLGNLELVPRVVVGDDLERAVLGADGWQAALLVLELAVLQKVLARRCKPAHKAAAAAPEQRRWVGVRVPQQEGDENNAVRRLAGRTSRPEGLLRSSSAGVF